MWSQSPGSLDECETNTVPVRETPSPGAQATITRSCIFSILEKKRTAKAITTIYTEGGVSMAFAAGGREVPMPWKCWRCSLHGPGRAHFHGQLDLVVGVRAIESPGVPVSVFSFVILHTL